jgi:hypothetical protein
VKWNNSSAYIKNREKVKNETAWVIGTGPSLRNIDASLLKDKPTITFNRAYVAFEDFLDGKRK